MSCASDYTSLLTLVAQDEKTAVVTVKDNDGKTIMDFIKTPSDESLRYLWEEKKRIHQIGLGVMLFNNCS
jgi:hypothetical protein